MLCGVSLPTRERELKPDPVEEVRKHWRSLPTRERELKLNLLEAALVDFLSLPTRERELKPPRCIQHPQDAPVAPYTGA